MPTPTADRLRVYFPSKNLAADGDALSQLVADAGGSLTTIVDAALTQADDYWNGAIGWFDGNTPTAALQGQFFHVKDFDAATDKLTLSKELPAVPAAGDTYRLALGGNWRSAQETFGMLVGGVLPELKTVSGVNITGLTIKKASALLGAGTLTVFYRRSQQMLYIKMGAQAFGVGLDTSVNITNGIVFAADGQAWLQVDVNAASLPTSDRTDTWTLAYPDRTLTPDFEGYETKNDVGGKTRYRLECVKNTDPADTMVDLSVYTGKPSGTQSTIAPGQSLDLTAGAFDVSDATGWPTKSFWIRNKTVNSGAGDCRYVNYRSGNTLYCFGVEWATLAFNTGTSEIRQGDVLTGESSGATAVVDQVVVTSGTWTGGTAAGTLLLKKVVGTFSISEYLLVSSVNKARAAAASVPGLRGYAAVAWAEINVIELMPDVDVGVNKPAVNQYENPASETVAPANVTFQAAFGAATALYMNHLGPGKLHGVWRREWIMDGHQSRAGIDADTKYFWS
jgi:hypothetical protein